MVKEVLSICHILLDNDYSQWLLNKILKKKLNIKYQTITCLKRDYGGVGHFEGFTNVVSRILQEFNIEVYTHPHKTIKGFSGFDI